MIILKTRESAAAFLGMSLSTFKRRRITPTATTEDGLALGWSEADLIKWKEENKK